MLLSTSLRRQLAVALLGVLSSTSALSQSAAGEEAGRTFDPISDTNWDDFLPISFMGVTLGGDQPPTISEPSICNCPSHLFGEDLPGIGITYWEPLYVAEVTRQPGNLLTLGGDNVLGASYYAETGGATGNSASDDSEGASRNQVHWYTYPIFELIDMAFDTECYNSSVGYNLAALTEVDSSWQDDAWAIVLSPEAAMFATLPFQVACLADAISASVSYPLDPLFWCVGTWGPTYPFSGNPNSQSSDQQSNALTLSKFLAMQFRLGMMEATIGPDAECSSTASPIWIKTQFRVDPVFPNPIYGSPIYIGQTEDRWGMAPPANFPSKQSSAYLIWVAHQCCLRF